MKPFIAYRSRTALVLSLLAFVSLITQSQPRTSATDAQQLLAKAIHDTNTVRTLVHHDTMTQVLPNHVTVTISVLGQEDEVRNRERDVESVTLKGVQRNGKHATVHYALEIIFVNGHTFARGLSPHTTWQIYAGTQFTDRISGVGFKRARTTVPTYTYVKSSVIDQGSSAAGTHLRAQLQTHQPHGASIVHGVLDLWVSTGSLPYIVREDIHGTVVQVVRERIHGKPVQRRYLIADTEHNTYGPLNQPLNIQAPVVGSSSST
jgi:hypothetical protein